MFTCDQIEEIKKKLIMLGTKDTQFPDAHKLNGEEIIAIVQDGENKKIPLSSIINDDFINVSKDTTEILTLSTAVSKIDINNRKLGQVITFKDSANSWAIRQFTGSSLDNWNDISLWKSISGIDELKSQVETNAEDISVLSDEIERHDASILNLNTDVSKLKDKDIETSSSLSELNTKVDTLKSQADTNTSNISSLNTEVSAMQSKVDENTTSISQINNNIADNNKSIAQINTTLEEHTESINANITTDRIENGAVTSEKIATSAFDNTLSVSGKIAPADVVGEKITELEGAINGKFVQLQVDITNKNAWKHGTIDAASGDVINSIVRVITEKLVVGDNAKNDTIAVNNINVAVIYCYDKNDEYLGRSFGSSVETKTIFNIKRAMSEYPTTYKIVLEMSSVTDVNAIGESVIINKKSDLYKEVYEDGLLNKHEHVEEQVKRISDNLIKLNLAIDGGEDYKIIDIRDAKSWEMGNIDTDGNETDSSVRCRTKLLKLTESARTAIIPVSNLSHAATVVCYDADKRFLGSKFKTTAINIPFALETYPETEYVRFVLYKITDTSVIGTTIIIDGNIELYSISYKNGLSGRCEDTEKNIECLNKNITEIQDTLSKIDIKKNLFDFSKLEDGYRNHNTKLTPVNPSSGMKCFLVDVSEMTGSYIRCTKKDGAAWQFRYSLFRDESGNYINNTLVEGRGGYYYIPENAKYFDCTWLSSDLPTEQDDVLMYVISRKEIESDGVRCLFKNFSYPGLLKSKCPKIYTKLLEKTSDVCIVTTGSSLTQGNLYTSIRRDAAERPPLMHGYDFTSLLWDKLSLIWQGQKYRMYNHPDLTYIGDWTVTNNATESGNSIWDDRSEFKNGLTNTTTSPSASVSTVIPKDAWQFNFIYRTDLTGGECTVSISEGNRLVEAWNGSEWIEANGYVLSMLESPVTSTKGNTCYQKRLKMRCRNKQGGINSIGIEKTITITKSNNESRMNIVGFEWSPREFMLTLINGARGSHNWGNGNYNLEKFQDNDIWEFNPDLIMCEVTLINWGASHESGITDNPQKFVDIAARCYFNENGDSPNSLFVKSNGYENCEVIFYEDTMHARYAFDENGSMKFGEVTSGDPKYIGIVKNISDNWRIVADYMDKKGYIYIHTLSEVFRIADEYYGTYPNAFKKSGGSGISLSYDGTHLNDNGAKLWSGIIISLFDM